MLMDSGPDTVTRVMAVVEAGLAHAVVDDTVRSPGRDTGPKLSYCELERSLCSPEETRLFLIGRSENRGRARVAPIRTDARREIAKNSVPRLNHASAGPTPGARCARPP